jgi:hypothetical protein
MSPELIWKIRSGAKVTKTYHLPTTSHRRAERPATVTAENKTVASVATPGAARVGVTRGPGRRWAIGTGSCGGSNLISTP